MSFTLHSEVVEIHQFNGQNIQGRLGSSSLITARLTILHVTGERALSFRPVLIFADSLDVERYRELRVLLKWR